MILASLNLGDSHKLEFGVKIAGTSNEPSACRFIINGSQYDIVCKSTKLSDTVVVEIPKLKTVLTPGVYKVKLEILLHDRVFEPVNEEVEFTPAINAVATSVKSNYTTRVIPVPDVDTDNISTIPGQLAKTEPEINLTSLLNSLSEGLSDNKTQLVKVIQESSAYTDIAEQFFPSDVEFDEYTDNLTKVTIHGKQGNDSYMFETVIVNKQKVLADETVYAKLNRNKKSLTDYL